MTFDPEVAARFRARRRVLNGAIVVTTGLLSLSFLPWPEEHASLLGALLMGAIVATVVPVLLVWRCPRCNTYLGGAASARTCPACGVPFVAPRGDDL
ncbi:hypothetical protein LXT21_43000 [Myxococcus sp. K38C18041901]|uniref:hypothetical protein n=1 Tax=Myxococcus guangdongensis TaxID=2906760 RepID=UPI0020A7AB5D|nr:hypothetical protein [Myxococcus guangdongensis]MCP3065555.1 hypothetical protein [Myxococcus guangdongensis]